MISSSAFETSRTRFWRWPGYWPLFLGLVVALYGFKTMLSAADATRPQAKLKFEEPRSLTGAIYARGSDRQKLLFRFKRQATRSGSTLTVKRDYTYPDGKPAAQEEIVYEGNNLVSLILREFQIGAEGSARIKYSTGQSAEGTIHFEYAKKQSVPAKARSEALRENTLIGDTIAPFLADHWDALMRSQKVRFRYIVVPRMETVGFTFVKEADSDAHNPETVLIKMEPTSRIIAALVDPLYFSVEKVSPHRVLQYDGRTTPKLNVRGNWDDLDAVTVFDWK
jgi:hypothetical protein